MIFVKSPIVSPPWMEGFDGPGWPLLWEVDKLISQIPTLPPMVPGRGVVGHYIDRCISLQGLQGGSEYFGGPNIT